MDAGLINRLVEEVEEEVVVVVKLYRSSYIVSQPGRSAELCPLPASRSPFSLSAWITGRGGVVAGRPPHSQGDQLWEWWAAWWWGPGPRVGPWQDYPASNTPNIMEGESLVSCRWFITISILWLLSGPDQAEQCPTDECLYFEIKKENKLNLSFIRTCYLQSYKFLQGLFMSQMNL